MWLQPMRNEDEYEKFASDDSRAHVTVSSSYHPAGKFLCRLLLHLISTEGLLVTVPLQQCSSRLALPCQYNNLHTLQH